jgi:hypothetical protein
MPRGWEVLDRELSELSDRKDEHQIEEELEGRDGPGAGSSVAAGVALVPRLEGFAP